MPTQLTHSENKPAFSPAAVRNPSPENEGKALVEERPLPDVSIQEKFATGFSGNGSSSGGGHGEESSNTANLFKHLKVQPKLTVGAPNDRYEREADRVADQIMRMPAPKKIQRVCTECEEELVQTKPLYHQISPLIQCQAIGEKKEKNLLTKSKTGATPVVTSSLESDINSLKGGGQPLDSATRNFFEPRFGYDLSKIRLHTSRQAVETAQALNAQAFTTGQNIVFGKGKYSPKAREGKQLLGHELTHTIQQGAVGDKLQRVCDPLLLAGRSTPVFFPRQTIIGAVYNGIRTLVKWTTHREAVGLIQQALVDLGYNLGAFGPRSDGVDRIFGSVTESGVDAFQTAEAISGATAGVIDEPTLRCLDEIRSHKVVPAHQAGTVTNDQYLIDNQKTGARDEDIYFPRGGSVLDAGDQAKIGRLLTRAGNPLRGCSITLEGFISEDELVESGPILASKRINAVDTEFVTQSHDDPGPACPAPAPPLRTHTSHPNASTGVSSYRDRRKVEVVAAGSSSTTTPCPAGAPQFRALTAPENTVLINAINLSKGWMDTALSRLIVGDPDSDAALTSYFGGTGRRGTIRSNLMIWRNHLNTTVRVRNRHGTQCNATCRAVAFNQGRGVNAWMNVCPRYFRPLASHPSLSQDEKKGLVVMHEAGHGSIGTRDTAYGHRRLIEFLASYPSLAEGNTDSYTLMVLCLNGFAGFCSAPSAADTNVGMSALEAERARRGLAWLETWLTWAQQDTTGVFKDMNRARQAGNGLNATNSYYGGVYNPPMVMAFDIHRPSGDPPPTFREQSMVAAILDRILTMKGAARAGLRVEKDISVAPVERWSAGPGDDLFLVGSYFLIESDRDRVERLLPLIIRANNSISATLRVSYETFIKENVRANRDNAP